MERASSAARDNVAANAKKDLERHKGGRNPF